VRERIQRRTQPSRAASGRRQRGKPVRGGAGISPRLGHTDDDHRLADPHRARGADHRPRPPEASPARGPLARDGLLAYPHSDHPAHDRSEDDQPAGGAAIPTTAPIPDARISCPCVSRGFRSVVEPSPTAPLRTALLAGGFREPVPTPHLSARAAATCCRPMCAPESAAPDLLSDRSQL